MIPMCIPIHLSSIQQDFSDLMATHPREIHETWHLDSVEGEALLEPGHSFDLINLLHYVQDLSRYVEIRNISEEVLLTRRRHESCRYFCVHLVCNEFSCV